MMDLSEKHIANVMEMLESIIFIIYVFILLGYAIFSFSLFPLELFDLLRIDLNSWYFLLTNCVTLRSFDQYVASFKAPWIVLV